MLVGAAAKDGAVFVQRDVGVSDVHLWRRRHGDEIAGQAIAAYLETGAIVITAALAVIRRYIDRLSVGVLEKSLTDQLRIFGYDPAARGNGEHRYVELRLEDAPGPQRHIGEIRDGHGHLVVVEETQGEGREVVRQDPVVVDFVERELIRLDDMALGDLVQRDRHPFRGPGSDCYLSAPVEVPPVVSVDLQLPIGGYCQRQRAVFPRDAGMLQFEQDIRSFDDD